MVNEFKLRRQKLYKSIGNDGIAIIPAGREFLRNGDVHFPFRQDSNFYYLTQFPEPQAAAVFVPGHFEGEFILFCREKDPIKERWEGHIIGQEEACLSFGADKAYSYHEIEEILPQLMQNREKLYYTLSVDQSFDHKILRWLDSTKKMVRRGIKAPNAIVDINSLLNEWRLIKSPIEQNMMKKAAEISAKAHIKAMQLCKPQMFEYELEAALTQVFIENGARFAAYPAIVASGKNACVLHYTRNTAQIQSQDSILIDAGCEYGHYASDVTRCFPASGKFSSEQKAVYEIVLAAQKAAIAKAHQGNTWNLMQETILEIITQGLIDLAIIKMSLAEALEKKAYFDFYMHSSGHWLGLDTHDAGDYKVNGKWRTLENGMVITVEPGLYIAHDNEAVAPHWRGIGIRIEDDIVIHDNAPIILTKDAPKEIDEIEQLMQ